MGLKLKFSRVFTTLEVKFIYVCYFEIVRAENFSYTFQLLVALND